jgi:hypothetical protein
MGDAGGDTDDPRSAEIAKPDTQVRSNAFVDLAIKNNMLVIPGSVCSEWNWHFQICYTVPNEKLEAGAELLCKLALE